jgi:hypothetical protein
MASAPTFFLSYAQGDEEPGNLIERFFYDLERRTARYARIDPRDPGKFLGTYDKRLLQGSDQRSRLGERLKTDKVFVPLLSPLYGTREYCGRELAAFIKRFSQPYVDHSGCLLVKHQENILAILWTKPEIYAGSRDGVVPRLLRNIVWKPSGTNDRQLKAAIERYEKGGMEKCVRARREYYDHLLDAFANRIIAMPELPPATFEPDLEEGDNAFAADWLKAAGGNQPQVEAPSAEPTGPGTLVALYITNLELPLDRRRITFADALVDEDACLTDIPEIRTPEGIRVKGVLAVLSEAAVLEGMQIFQCTGNAKTREQAEQLTEQLAQLTGRNVLIALVIDPDVWRGVPSPASSEVETVAMSDRWAGLVIVPLPDQAQASAGIVADLDRWRAEKHVARAIMMFSPTSSMVAPVRMQIVAEQGRVMKTGVPVVPTSADKPPILSVRNVRR